MPFRLVNRHKMLAPNKCIICEHSPEFRVVDTGFKMTNVPAKNILRGRKYICEACAEKSSKAFGFVSQERYEDTLQRMIDANNEIDRLSALVESFGNFEKWIESMTNPTVFLSPPEGVSLVEVPVVEDEDADSTGGD